MYICMYVHIHIYIHIYMKTHKYMHTHIYIYIYVFIQTCTRTHTRTHTHFTCEYMYTHAHTQHLSHEDGSLIPLCSATNTIIYYEPITKFWKRNIIRQRDGLSIAGFWGRYFGCWTASKRGALVHKNSLASCQGCRHSIELRALTCPFKQSNRSAWSLLIWHPTHIYLWGRLCFIQVVRSPPSPFYYKDINQKIVYTLLLEESGLSKKWVILMYKRQDSNATSTPAGKSGPSAQDRYCARGLGEGANKRRGNKEVKRQV